MQLMQFSGHVDVIQAREGRPPRVAILAYSGGLMTVGGFGRVVIDLQGLELPATIPLLIDHDARIDGIAGSGTPSIEANKLVVSGTLASSEAGGKLRALAADGIPLEASVGVAPDRNRLETVRPGQSVVVNGRTIQAGREAFTVVRAGRLREVSILPNGADSSTHVSIAAKGQTTMNDDVHQTDEQPDLIAAERERVREIMEITEAGPGGSAAGEDLGRIRAAAISEGWTLDRVRKAALDALRDNRYNGDRLQAQRDRDMLGLPGAIVKRGGYGSGRGGRPVDRLQACALLMAGQDAAVVKHFGEHVAEQLSAHRPTGWPELAAMALQSEARMVPSDRNELLTAAFSTTSMPIALGSAIEKVVLDTFVELSSNWRPLARIANARDFKDHSAIRLSAAGGFEEVGPTGEIKHGDLMEESFPFRVRTFARMFGLTRQALINDDASVLSDLPMVLGSEGARSVSDTFFEVLTGNANSFFHADNNNLLTTGSALSIESMGEAIALLRRQKDRDGRLIGFQPTTLVVPAALESTARQVLNSTTVARDQSVDNQGTASPFAGLNVSLVVEPRLDDTSEDEWYLFAQPRYAPLIVAFLGNAQGPRVEQSEVPFNKLGLQWRAYLDHGSTQGEPKAVVKATGAAGE